ncbi:hypothetical protein D9M72_214470 [compost metagenome]
MHTLVIVPAMMSVLRPVALTASTNSGLSQALISPLRATYRACGALAWISGISGPLGPCGTEAVVMTGSLARVAMEASAAARARSSGMGMSPTVWNRPLWWSISSMTASSGSMTGRWPLKLAGADMEFSFENRRRCAEQESRMAARIIKMERTWRKTDFSLSVFYF